MCIHVLITSDACDVLQLILWYSCFLFAQPIIILLFCIFEFCKLDKISLSSCVTITTQTVQKCLKKVVRHTWLIFVIKFMFMFATSDISQSTNICQLSHRFNSRICSNKKWVLTKNSRFLKHFPVILTQNGPVIKMVTT